MRFLCSLLLLCLMSISASTHELRPAYLELRQTGQDTFDVLWKVPALGSDLRLALDVELPKEVVSLSEPATRHVSNAFVARWQIRDPAALAGRAIRISGLADTLTDALVRIVWRDGAVQVARLTPSSPAFKVDPHASVMAVGATYGWMGIEHILTGYDHLLFLLAMLMIVRGIPKLLGTITAFTVAHSITLALASLGVVQIARPPIEAMIALSIVVVASEAARMRRGQAGLTARYPWVVAFPFGLLHGLGFASALLDVGLPRHDVPLALFTFNLGVECGQLIFIGAMLGLARLIGGIDWIRNVPVPLRPVMNYGIGTIAGFWLIERSAALLSG